MSVSLVPPAFDLIASLLATWTRVGCGLRAGLPTVATAPSAVAKSLTLVVMRIELPQRRARSAALGDPVARRLSAPVPAPPSPPPAS